MQAGRRREEAHAAFDRAALGVGRAVIEAADARKRDRSRAHGAGLERDVEVAVDQPFAAERRGGLPQGHDLGMGGGVAIGERAITGLRDQVTVAGDHAADWNLAGGGRRMRLIEGEVHESVRRHARRSLVTLLSRRGLRSELNDQANQADGPTGRPVGIR